MNVNTAIVTKGKQARSTKKVHCMISILIQLVLTIINPTKSGLI